MNNNSSVRTFYRTRDNNDGRSPPRDFGDDGPKYQYQQQHNDVDDMPPPHIRVTALDAEVFGQAIHDKLQSLELPRAKAPRDFVPLSKTVEELFKEDEMSSANYASTIADDDVIKVDCGGRELVKIENWSDGGFPDSLMKNIKRSQYIKPRQIQSTAIPLILDGYDVIGHAETGSGKTGAYLIPIVSECIEAKKNGTFKSDGGYPYCVIITPTRELARQCYEQALKFAHDTGVSVAQTYGEIGTRTSVKIINEGCDILCITPGRFKHLSDEGCIGFNKLRYLVFDEGDHLLNPTFWNDIRPVLELPSFPNGKLRQTLFFSATFTEEILETAKQLMRPEGCRALVSNHMNVVNKRCVQKFLSPGDREKFFDIVELLRKELENVDNDVAKFPRTLIFCNTREYCEKLTNALRCSGINAQPLNGMQAQDLREKAYDEFRTNKISCLIVTDVCARGIDIKELDLVINYDMPREYDTYVHRAGRVGRIREGRCISYVSLQRDKPILIEIKEGMQKSGHIVPPSLDEVLNKAPEPAAENQSPFEETPVQVKEAPAENVKEISGQAEKALNPSSVASIPDQVKEAPAGSLPSRDEISGQVQEAHVEIPSLDKAPGPAKETPLESPKPLEETSGQVKEEPAEDAKEISGPPTWSKITPQPPAGNDDEDDW